MLLKVDGCTVFILPRFKSLSAQMANFAHRQYTLNVNMLFDINVSYTAVVVIHYK